MKVLKSSRIYLILFILSVSQTPLSSQNPDIQILRAINSQEQLPSDDFFRFISNSESYIVAAVPVTIGIMGLIKHDDKQFRNGCVIAASSLFCAGITLAMKYTINRERPFVTYPDITKKSGAGSPSFPSGHTSSAFATATSLSLVYPEWYVIVPSYGWAATVGYSRMHLGVHYPSDVLAGAAIGTGCSLLTNFVNKKLILKKKNPKSNF